MTVIELVRPSGRRQSFVYEGRQNKDGVQSAVIWYFRRVRTRRLIPLTQVGLRQKDAAMKPMQLSLTRTNWGVGEIGCPKSGARLCVGKRLLGHAWKAPESTG